MRRKIKEDITARFGRIYYSMVDGESAADGVLIYIKPACYGNEPRDTYEYFKTNKNFLHESTADQFSESQFESYRMLGVHRMERLSLRIAPAIFATSHKRKKMRLSQDENGFKRVQISELEYFDRSKTTMLNFVWLHVCSCSWARGHNVQVLPAERRGTMTFILSTITWVGRCAETG
jgi:hypothetical protein